jgi:hypothetical protein
MSFEGALEKSTDMNEKRAMMMMAMPRATLEDIILVRRATRYRKDRAQAGVVVGPWCGGGIESGVCSFWETEEGKGKM